MTTCYWGGSLPDSWLNELTCAAGDGRVYYSVDCLEVSDGKLLFNAGSAETCVLGIAVAFGKAHKK